MFHPGCGTQGREERFPLIKRFDVLLRQGEVETLCKMLMLWAPREQPAIQIFSETLWACRESVLFCGFVAVVLIQ